MAIFGWVIWAIACVVLFSFILAALSTHDTGLRRHHYQHCLLLTIGLIITILIPISKLHLLWWVPITFALNMLLSSTIISLRLKRGMRNFEKQRHKVSVIAVDDNEQFLGLVSSILTNEVYEVDTAINGYEALNKIEKKKYDLLITGIRMPGMNGFELYENVKKIDPFLINKTIIISGSIHSSDTKEFLSKHSLPYLPKPFKPPELVDRVKLLLREGK